MTRSMFLSCSGLAELRTGGQRAALRFGAGVLACAVASAVVSAGGGAVAQASTITYLSQFGSQGSGPGQFGSPADVAFDPGTGHVYVTDVVNDVVEVFDSAGSYLSEFGGPAGGNGPFTPASIAADPKTGDIYVVDATNNQIDKFGSSGNFLLSWNGSFNTPSSVAVDPATGDVYITDYYEYRVVKFDSSGNFLLTWGWGVTDSAARLETCTSSCQPGIQGDGNGQFNFPTTIAVDTGTGDVYVADNDSRIQEFDSAGDYLTQFGSYGSGDGQFGNNTEEILSPAGIAVDPATRDVYAVDGGNNRVEAFDSAGNYLYQFGSPGSGNGQFSFPGGDALDPGTGDLYVADGSNHRVEVFGSGASGTTITVSSSANPSVSGQSVTYTAAASPVPSAGTVASFSDNGKPITSCSSQPVSSTGNATCTVGYADTGSHRIIASLSGSESQILAQTVKPDATTTQVTSSASPPPCNFSCPVTFTATVSANAPGAGIPTGTVSFASNGSGVFTGRQCTLSPAGSSAASCQVTYTPRGSGSQTITATYSGVSAYLTSSGTASVTAVSGTYVALGDSYSAGTGAPPYLSSDGCYRSALSWPYLISADLGFTGSSFSFHPCAGAIIQNLTTQPQKVASGLEPPQEQWLSPSTQLVTLTVGGNDADFAQVMATCVFIEACQVDWQKAVNLRISQLGSPLASLYETIAAKAPNATIIVMGYPRFFPVVPPLACSTGLGLLLFVRPQMIWINSEIQSMDNTIANAVAAARQDGYKSVRYVSGSYDAFTGHEMCTADPYYNVFVPSLSQIPSSFHPNQSGNAQMAQLAEQAYQAP